MSQDETPISYFDRRLKIDAVKLLPGQYYVTASNKALVTILGSCVAACIYDEEKQIGGMNHFMLPDLTASSDITNSLVTKYGVHAMNVLISQLIRLGARREKLVAKAFGGGKVVQGMVQQDIGNVNAEFVVQYLSNANIPLKSFDLKSNYARKIYFFPSNGNVYMKRIRDFHNETLQNRESVHYKLLSEQAQSGEIPLSEALYAYKSSGC